MGRVKNLNGLMGMIKDKASQSKAAFISKPNTLSFHLALLKSTTHNPFTSPNEKHLTTLLSIGQSSRATASSAVEVLMDRLQNTRNSAVALKCLIAVHYIIKNGGFILQDQLSIFPFTGGRNYLKLSDFRDNSCPISWELSSWVRWYAQYIETLLSISRILGFFVGSFTSIAEKEKKSELISTILNSDLLKEIESLVGLIEETSKKPNSLHLNENKLVDKIMGLVGEDYLSAMEEVSVRVREFHERMNLLGFGESVELVCALKRLEDCKEKQLEISVKYEVLIDRFWGLVSETKSMVKGFKENREGGKLGAAISRSRICGSARINGRSFFSIDSVRFGSARFDSNEKHFPVQDLMGPY